VSFGAGFFGDHDTREEAEAVIAANGGGTLYRRADAAEALVARLARALDAVAYVHVFLDHVCLLCAARVIATDEFVHEPTCVLADPAVAAALAREAEATDV
jgi:hypothetical protein